ncbi:hypothetical protein K432DRAFT_410795 [Lepidopterella palustris CBS 459.81]|uniref:Arrestin-like N-terminal domain-containing protein n=1 Tax=Lepidopterella palustris CBS 459.81 TaxID=1314670 RepID=A0A8E2J919_9PEZI|nr:hypothetical protein K432DRAFT_410795 [Lepidopterella palustris CBS 459.81]
MVDGSHLVVGIEILECEACGPSDGSFGCTRPGNSLEGRVHVSTTLILEFTTLEVSFKGLQSTLVRGYRAPNNEIIAYPPPYHYPPVITKTTDLFLDVKYQAPCHSIDIDDEADGLRVYSFPFAFVLPRGTEYPDQEKPLVCQILPPSFNTGQSYSSQWGPTSPPLLSVTYMLHAIVRYRAEHAGDRAEPRSAEVTRIIDFLPYSDVQPPTPTDSFPDEFVLSATTPIWKYSLGGRLGFLEIFTREPLPLAYSSYSPTTSTECTLSVIAHSAAPAIQQLRALSLEIQAAIRVKTFFSTEPMVCLPKQTFLTQTACIRLHDEVIDLSRERYTQLEWEYSSGLRNVKPPAYEDIIRNHSFSTTSTSSGSSVLRFWASDSSVLSDNDGGSAWSVTVRIPIKPQAKLLPTFCSSLIARSYSVVLRVKVTGVHAKKIDFEVPLQVVYLQSPHMAAATESGHCAGPAALLAQQDVLPAYGIQ